MRFGDVVRRTVRPCAGPSPRATADCWPTAAPAASRRWCCRRVPHRRAVRWPPPWAPLSPWPCRRPAAQTDDGAAAAGRRRRLRSFVAGAVADGAPNDADDGGGDDD